LRAEGLDTSVRTHDDNDDEFGFESTGDSAASPGAARQAIADALAAKVAAARARMQAGEDDADAMTNAIAAAKAAAQQEQAALEHS